MNFRIIALAAVSLLIAAAARAERLYIDIAAPGIKPIPVAVPAMKVIGDLPKSVEPPNISVIEELRRDIEVVGEFSLIDPRGYLEDSRAAPLAPTDESYAGWRVLEAELLIKSQIEAVGQNEYRLEFHAYDVTRRAFVMGKRYRSPAKAVNEVAHMFANSLLEELTGKAGAFGTEIAFVVKKGRTKNIASIKMNGTGFRMQTQVHIKSVPEE